MYGAYTANVKVFETVERFYSSYRGEKQIIGYSVLNRPIFAMKAGKSSDHTACAIVQAAIHAREFITAFLVLEQLRLGIERGCVWFIPLVNPDGAELCNFGIESVPSYAVKRRKFLLSTNGSNNFSLWKANANAVDLNVNFDARWGTGLHNVCFPAAAGYVGRAPFSEPESAALRDFTLKIKPKFTVSYHTQGKELYWDFHQPIMRQIRDKKYASMLSALTGYPMRTAPQSAGGYKDWCIEKLKIPSFTVEVGAGAHPLTQKSLDDILKENLTTIDRFSKSFFS